MFITHGINMGECLVVSYIIRTFVLSVVNTETGSTIGFVAEGGLRPALYYI